jgi:hydrogenase-4 component B
MQYTSSSFANTLVALFRWLLRPQIHQTPPKDLFPGPSCFESHVPEIVLDGGLNPLWRRLKAQLASARWVQQGRVQRYLLYILLALFALLLSLVPVAELAKRLLGH